MCAIVVPPPKAGQKAEEVIKKYMEEVSAVPDEVTMQVPTISKITAHYGFCHSLAPCTHNH